MLLLVDEVLLSAVIEPPGLPTDELVEDDGLELEIAELLGVSRLATDLLIDTTCAQSSRPSEAEADALPTPLTLPDTLADGDDVARQVTLTLSPLFRSLRSAAAFESTLSVRLLAPVMAGDGFRVMVRAV
jgi:hypothetical protein